MTALFCTDLWSVNESGYMVLSAIADRNIAVQKIESWQLTNSKRL